jgi:tellurite resistance protein TehA-like permease
MEEADTEFHVVVCWPRLYYETFPNSVRWFSVTMGTGIVSILLHNLPYNGIWLYWISVVIFALNVLLFTLFLVISILRYTLYPRTWSVMIRHPAQSLFLGTVPMGLAIIVNMIVFVCVPAWGTWAVYLVRSVPSCSRRFTNKTRPGLYGGLMWWYLLLPAFIFLLQCERLLEMLPGNKIVPSAYL